MPDQSYALNLEDGRAALGSPNVDFRFSLKLTFSKGRGDQDGQNGEGDNTVLHCW